MGFAPLGLIPVDVAADLSGPGTERPTERLQLAYLAGVRIQGETMLCEGGGPGSWAYVVTRRQHDLLDQHVPSSTNRA